MRALSRRRRRNLRSLLLALAAVVALSVVGPVIAAQRWEGGDEWPEPSAPPPPSPSPPAPFPVYGSGPATLFMSESRPLQVGVKLTEASYYTLAAVINYLYVRRHGYTMHYYHLHFNSSKVGVDTEFARNRGWACYNHRLGLPRHPSWCKLLPAWLEASAPAADPTLWAPVSRSLPSGARTEQAALFFDSDSFVVDTAATIADLMYSPRYWGGSRFWMRPQYNASLVFLRDLGWDHGEQGYCNGGFFLIRPGAAARRFFHVWWNVNDTKFNLRHSFEQYSLNDVVKMDPRLSVSVVQLLDVMHVNQTKRQWLRHLPGYYPPWTRSGLMLEHLVRLGINNETFAALTREMVQRGVVVTIDSVAVAAALEREAEPEGILSLRN